MTERLLRNGAHLAELGDTTAMLWTRTASPRRTVALAAEPLDVRGARLLADGTLVVATATELLVIEPEATTATRHAWAEPLTGELEIHPSGRSGVTQAWRLNDATGREEFEVRTQPLPPPHGAPEHLLWIGDERLPVAFTPDGARLLIARPGAVVEYDAVTGNRLAKIPCKGTPDGSLVCSQDGQRALARFRAADGNPFKSLLSLITRKVEATFADSATWPGEFEAASY